MFSKFRRGLAATAALVTLALGASARADLVTYYTEGYFAGTTPTNVGDQYTDVYSDSLVSITFLGENDNTVLVAPPVTTSAAKMGDFVVTTKATGVDSSLNGTTFTLALFQKSPAGTASPSQLVGTATGVITVAGSGQPYGSNLTISFNPFTFYVASSPAYSYTVQQSTTIQAGVSGTDTTLNGTVTELPLPSTASAGLVALGGLAAFGGIKKLRERNAASLAV
jgi:hypothetical protein